MGSYDDYLPTTELRNHGGARTGAGRRHPSLPSSATYARVALFRSEHARDFIVAGSCYGDGLNAGADLRRAERISMAAPVKWMTRPSEVGRRYGNQHSVVFALVPSCLYRDHFSWMFSSLLKYLCRQGVDKSAFKHLVNLSKDAK